MGKKLYVGNLSYTVDSTQLSTIFGQIGAVDSANVIMDRDTGRSKGFGFVEMSSDGDVQAAIQKFHGTELGGRAMNVSEAKPMVPRSEGSRGGYSSNRSY